MEDKWESLPCNSKVLPTFPAKVSLAMAYIPYQKFENLYSPEKALEAGTLFSGLDKPFLGGAKK
ncbi:MAG: spore coat associated protein CotJA [Oscillospiraceae bacterium]|jgi:hypothetical protein|nr:spore coat associated protein CotJA [Oscillospiraceae bacterium]